MGPRYPGGTKKSSSSRRGKWGDIDLSKGSTCGAPGISYANRGKNLEKRIETVLDHYLYLGKAVIQKVATPMQQATGPSGNKVWIHGAKSTVDFIGIITGGQGVAFDAKENKLKTRFELKNIKDHQIEFLRHFKKLGGAAFFIIEFTAHNQIFLVDIMEIAPIYYEAAIKDGKKSIPFEWFKDKPQIKQGRGVALDFLAHL